MSQRDGAVVPLLANLTSYPQPANYACNHSTPDVAIAVVSFMWVDLALAAIPYIVIQHEGLDTLCSRCTQAGNTPGFALSQGYSMSQWLLAHKRDTKASKFGAVIIDAAQQLTNFEDSNTITSAVRHATCLVE